MQQTKNNIYIYFISIYSATCVMQALMCWKRSFLITMFVEMSNIRQITTAVSGVAIHMYCWQIGRVGLHGNMAIHCSLNWLNIVIRMF